MWYKVKELKSKGLHCVQIAHELGLHRHTVEKYVRMTLEEFQASQSYEREFKHKLDIYEEEVKNELIRAPYLSSRQIHDHLHADNQRSFLIRQTHTNAIAFCSTFRRKRREAG